jgi:2,4-dienoyl-CoA reductase-like NADH-dependent reductase (Old Yellow Enzyme family)
MTTSAIAALSAPLALRSSERLPNRLAKAAMTEGLATPDGRPTRELETLYRTWAAGGAGLLITGNVVIDRAHRERPGNVVIASPPDPEMKILLKRWAEAAREHGAGLWMQISHAGRQTPAVVNPRPKAPSAIPLALPGKNFGAPEAMTEAEIRDVIARFAIAAGAAREAGFSGVQVHAAHGYLVSTFLSPRANQRTDDWGGPLENRARLLLEIVRAVRVEAGRDFTLSVKINSADFQKGGFAASESLDICDRLAEEGVDVIEISGGTYEQPRMALIEGREPADLSGLEDIALAREAYFLEFATLLRKRLRTPLMVTGGFRTTPAMARAVTEEGVALIGIARPMTTDPDAPRRIFEGAGALARVEDQLRLGPGPLGPKSPFKALNGFGAMYWHYQQLRRLGAGLAPDMKLSLLSAMIREQKDQAARL